MKTLKAYMNHKDASIELKEILNRLGSPTEGILVFEDTDREDVVVYVAYKSFSKDSQIDDSNKFVITMFDDEDLVKGTDFKPFGINTSFGDLLVDPTSSQYTKVDLSSDEWHTNVAEQIVDELNYLTMNTDYHYKTVTFDPNSFANTFDDYGDFGKIVEHKLDTAKGIRFYAEDETASEPDTDLLKAACKAEPSIREFQKVLKRLIKDFSLGEPLNVLVKRWSDGSFGSVYYFFDGFTICFSVSDYGTTSFTVQKNTPYAIRHKEVNVSKTYKSGWSPARADFKDYDRYFKPFFAKWLDRIRDNWRISLDDDTEEAIDEVLANK